MNILFVVPYTPSPIRVRSLNLIRTLLELGHRVNLLYILEKDIHDEKLNTFPLHKKKSVNLSRWDSLFNCIKAIPTNQPLQAVYSWKKELAKTIKDILQNQQIDIVHVEHLRAARYALYIKNHFSIPVIWDSVDSISHLFEQTKKNHPNKLIRFLITFELARTKRYEKFLLKKFDSVLVTSSIDQRQFLNMVPDSPVEVVTNGVDLEYFSPVPYENRNKNTILISGKMSYHANINMAIYAIEEIMPQVWKHNSEIELWIVGKDPPSYLQKFSDNRMIKITGSVPELKSYLQSAALALAPLNYGAGVQNKVLEAMACATPVIASPLAASALKVTHGNQLMIAEDTNHFVEHIIALLTNHDLSAKIGNSGRKYVEDEHSWLKIGKRLEQVYLDAINQRNYKNIL